MPPTTRRHRETIEALKAIIHESILHPEKKKEFVDEGSVELIIGLCDSKNIPWSLATYCAAALRILAHGNDKVKAEIVGLGGLKPLSKLCNPDTVADCTAVDPATEDEAFWRFRAHEQAAAVLHVLCFQSSVCQAEMVSAGTIKQLVKLCDVFNGKGCHRNCCMVVNIFPNEANNLLHELTQGKKLVGKVQEMSQEDIRAEAQQLLKSGLVLEAGTRVPAPVYFEESSQLVLGNVSGMIEVRRMYGIDLYDTTTDRDVKISDELIKSNLVWPDMSVTGSDSSKEEDKYIKQKVSQVKEENFVWADISVTEVVDAGHFWAHVGGEPVKRKIEEINATLLSSSPQGWSPLCTVPEPGTLVSVLENIAGHRDLYRAQVLETQHYADENLAAKVFALDYGFTTIVSKDCLYTLPEDLMELSPQATLCCLLGIQPPPKSAEVLEHAAGALRNLSYENNSYRLYIAAQEGLEALIKLCTIPNKEVCKQAVGALLNLSLNFKVKARIGFLGGIPVLLDVCQRSNDDEEIILLSVGAIQNLVQDSFVNRCRLADNHGLIILTQLYYSSGSEAVKTRCLYAIKNLIGSYITTLEKDPVAGNIFTLTPSSSGPFDTRSISDDTTTKRFSMSVSDDDTTVVEGRKRRRRRRLRHGEVEPKPTPVALSPDIISRSSAGESDRYISSNGFSNNSGSYDDTDGDTDGERLVQNTQVATTTDDTCNTDVNNEKYYVQGYHVPFCEDDLHDFRSQTNIHNISTRAVGRSLCAFLNSGKCGTVYLGLRKDGVVAGLKISRKERDLLRLGVDEMIDRFSPSVKHHCYQVDFIPVVRSVGSDSPTSRKQVDDRFVVEIKIVSCPGLIYATREGKTFFRHKSRNEELTAQEVREKTIKEQEDLYNNEMQSLRLELEELKKKLHQNSNEVQNSLQDKIAQTSAREERPVLNSKRTVPSPGTNVTSSPSNQPTGSQDDLQNANCIIS